MSSATVSRVLNNDPGLSVSADTRERIFAIAEELQYKPSRLKRMKKENELSSLEIGLLLCTSQEQESEDPYFASIRRGVERRCEELGVSIGKVWRENSGMDMQPLNHLGGVIVVGSISEQQIMHMLGDKTNIVLVDHSLRFRHYDSINLNFKQAVQDVMDHLSSLGHSRIGYIGGHEEGGANEQRLANFKQIAELNGFTSPEWMLTGEWTTNNGYELMKQMLELKEWPSACFVGSDPMAIGALRALHERGVKVPEEMAVIGFDDIEVSAFVSPPLTSVKVYTEQMGRTAVQLLLERVEGREVPLHVIIDTTLMIRESCGGK